MDDLESLLLNVQLHGNFVYCLTKISTQEKHSISHVISLFNIPSPFLYIARTKAILTGLKAYKLRFMASATVFRMEKKKEYLVRQ